jgi:hypothetical protein
MPGWGVAGEAKFRLAGLVAKVFYRALILTTDGELENREAAARARAGGRPIVYAFWHGRLMVPVWTHRGRGIGILISRSRDGEYVARVAQGFGFHVIRGSSSRGAEAGFRALVAELEGGRDVAITPDGPRGPRYEVKKGLIYLARAANAAIIPVGIAIDRYRQLGSWDEFRVMKPFCYILARYGEAITVPERANKFEMEDLRLKVEEDLKALTADVEARVAEARRTKRERTRFQGE